MENAKIAKKLVAVMNECSHVAKNGINSFHNYKYATAEDVLQKVNESLTKNKLASIVCPTLESMVDVTNLKGNTEHLATVTVQIHLIDSDSGESVDLFGIGSGQDAGDKAVMKAQTAAIKYAFMLSLCIATGDDPEADGKTDEVTCTESQQNIKPVATKPKAAPKKTAGEGVAICAGCGEEITSEKVVQFSVNRFGQPLCMDCQKKANRAA
jgi:hypothetical protein